MTVLGWKCHEPRFAGAFGDMGGSDLYLDYGWPRSCVTLWSHAEDRGPPVPITSYQVTSWQSLAQDAFIATVSLIATWLLLSRTQRRCRHWWQFSLATLLTFSSLAALACAVLNSKSLWGW